MTRSFKRVKNKINCNPVQPTSEDERESFWMKIEKKESCDYEIDLTCPYLYKMPDMAYLKNIDSKHYSTIMRKSRCTFDKSKFEIESAVYDLSWYNSTMMRTAYPHLIPGTQCKHPSKMV